MQIELSYINTNHPDFTDGASLVSSVTMNHEMVSSHILLKVTIYRQKRKHNSDKNAILVMGVGWEISSVLLVNK